MFMFLPNEKNDLSPSGFVYNTGCSVLIFHVDFLFSFLLYTISTVPFYISIRDFFATTISIKLVYYSVVVDDNEFTQLQHTWLLQCGTCNICLMEIS
jgi:hypothetical protein